MQTTSLLRSPAFVIALLYAVVFSAASLLMVVFVYSATVGSVTGEVDAALERAGRELEAILALDGRPGLAQAVRRRVEAATGRESVYLLSGPDGALLEGNLRRWPRVQRLPGVAVEFMVDAPDDARRPRHRVRAMVFRLTSGQWLLVGRDIEQLLDFEGRVLRALGWALLVTLGVGIPGALALNMRLRRRVESINAMTRTIASGRLSERLPVRQPGDEIDRLALHINDMLERLEQLMLGMRTVVDGIAHDMRAPLTRLHTRVELALARPGDGAGQQQALELVLSETDRLVKLFEALVSIAQAESGVRPTELERVDLGALTSELGELYAPVMEAAGQCLQVELEADVAVWGQRELLAQAMVNLLDNALKYAGSPAVVRLLLSADAEQARLSVADNGPGIPEGERDRALQRFIRLSGSAGVHGSGLGLSLVGATARLHQGQVELGDNQPGLRVSLLLPRHTAATGPR